MSSTRALGIQAFRIVVPLLILGGGVVSMEMLRGMREIPQPQDPSDEMPLVRVQRAEELSDDAFEFTVDGTVIPFRQVAIATEIAGRIETKEPICRVGVFVNEGDPLLQIDHRELQLEVSRLEEEKRQAEFSLAEHLVDLDNVKAVISLLRRDLALQTKELNRLIDLQRSAAATASSVDNQERQVLVSNNALVEGENRLRSLQSKSKTLQSGIEVVVQRLARAQLDLDRTRIVAPISGVVTEEHVEEDSFVQRGTVLVTIEDTSRSEVTCNLKMDELYWLWQQPVGDEAGREMSLIYDIPDTPVEVIYELMGNSYSWKGMLTRYEGLGLDERTRTVPCRIDVSDPRVFQVNGRPLDSLSADKGPPALVRGMFVKVRIKTKPDSLLIELPEVAIRPGDIVWVVNSKDCLERRPIRIASSDGGRVILHGSKSRLDVGERVVISPIKTETSGARVRVAGDSEPESTEQAVTQERDLSS